MKILSTQLNIKKKQNFPHVQSGENDIILTITNDGIYETINEALFKLHELATHEIQTAVVNSNFRIEFYKASTACMVYVLTVGNSYSHGVVGEACDLEQERDPNYNQVIFTYTAFKPFTPNPYLGTPTFQFKNGLEIYMENGRYPERWDEHSTKRHILVKGLDVNEVFYPYEVDSHLLEEVDLNTLEDGLYRIDQGLLVKCDYTLEQLKS